MPHLRVIQAIHMMHLDALDELGFEPTSQIRHEFLTVEVTMGPVESRSNGDHADCPKLSDPVRHGTHDCTIIWLISERRLLILIAGIQRDLKLLKVDELLRWVVTEHVPWLVTLVGYGLWQVRRKGDLEIPNIGILRSNQKEV